MIMGSKLTQGGYGIPLAIISAGLLIAAAVIFTRGGGDSSGRSAAVGSTSEQRGSQLSGDFRLPSESDHVRGNVDAKVAIIEFSDLECPFCARLHPTLVRLTEENTDVKWIYRHFPLSSHSNAFGAAIASECVAKLAGEEIFWDFTDAAFANQRRLSKDFYEESAVSYGIGVDEFASCLKDKSISREVQKDLDEVIRAGGRGTPFSVIVTASGELVPFSGALPYEQIKNLVDQALVN